MCIFQVNGYEPQPSGSCTATHNHGRDITRKDHPHSSKVHWESRSFAKHPEFSKTPNPEAVGRLLKQYTHASHVIALAYAEEIEKVCKSESEKDDRGNSELELPTNLSHKQPCCSVAWNLRTYMLQNVSCPFNTYCQEDIPHFDTHLNSALTQRDQMFQYSPSSTSGAHFVSTRKSLKEQVKICVSAEDKDISSINVKNLNLKTIHSVVFSRSKDSMWVCGQTKKKIGKKCKPTFAGVELPNYKVKLRKIYDKDKVDTPILMTHVSDYLFFTYQNQNGCHVHKFDIESKKFDHVFSNAKLKIAGMCGRKTSCTF